MHTKWTTIQCTFQFIYCSRCPAVCGIVGRAVRKGASLGLTSEAKSDGLNSIRHRGPDMHGQYEDACVWLGHRRLSILDLSSAAGQPMVSDDGRYVICYNGEVYNFSELARSMGFQDLNTRSDSEVVLRAFECLGVKAIAHFNGMFAFAIYDRHSGQLWLVRDRMGIKPLYYCLDEHRLSFASEVKALHAMDTGTPRCEISAMHEWLYFGASLGERTLYKGVRKLLPGHYLVLDLATFSTRIECYWSPAQYAGGIKHKGSAREQGRQVRDLLEQAVKRQLISDVPVGVFLSGGIDSSAITAFASRHCSGRLATYSVGFDFDKGINELPKARAVSRRFGTEHTEMHISGVEIADIVEQMVNAHDMPFSDAANIPLYLLSSKISNRTKVILQGDGGDEMFGGYSRYSTLSFYKLARMWAKIGIAFNPFLRHDGKYFRYRRYINALRPADISEVMALLLTEEDRQSNPLEIFLPGFRHELLQYDPFERYRECQAQFRDEDVVNQMLMVDAMIILPDIFLEKVDRATMAASIEVRVPFLDNDLVDFCMRLSGSQKVRFGVKKWLLKKALDGVVPKDVLCGKKTGFGVPYGYWLRGALKTFFFDHLETFRINHSGVLDDQLIRNMYSQHCGHVRDHSFMLWKILNLMIWSNRSHVEFAV